MRTTGRYDAGHKLLVRNRPFDGQVGFHVLAPLVTAAGPALLVDRGWVPAGEDATVVPDVPAPPPGEVTVTVRLRPSEPASTTGTPPRGQVTRIDVSAIAGSSLPGVRRVRRADPGGAAGRGTLPPGSTCPS